MTMRDHLMGWVGAVGQVVAQNPHPTKPGKAVPWETSSGAFAAFEKGDHKPPLTFQGSGQGEIKGGGASAQNLPKPSCDDEPLPFWSAASCRCAKHNRMSAGAGPCGYCWEGDFDERTFDCRPREDGWYTGSFPRDGEYLVLEVGQAYLDTVPSLEKFAGFPSLVRGQEVISNARKLAAITVGFVRLWKPID